MTTFHSFSAIPKDIDYEEVKTSLSNIEGVKFVHSLHVWSLTLDKVAAEVHLAVGEYNIHRVLPVLGAPPSTHAVVNANPVPPWSGIRHLIHHSFDLYLFRIVKVVGVQGLIQLHPILIGCNCSTDGVGRAYEFLL
jgi:hypothetical protein